MTISRNINWLFMFLIVLILAGCQSSRTYLPADVTPVQATWLYGKHTIPAKYTEVNKILTFQHRVGDPRWYYLARSGIKPGLKVPVVLYFHGCRGMTPQAELYTDILIEEGYAVFMPDSFRRPGRKECAEQGKLKDRLPLRIEELEYALDQVKKLPWVNQDRLVLMGFSEGGNTTDNWDKPGFIGHIVMGSACTLVGGKPAAPSGTPVLAVVGAKDRFRPGKSCSIDESDGISKSIVIPEAGHSVAHYPVTQEAIRTFLGSI